MAQFSNPICSFNDFKVAELSLDAWGRKENPDRKGRDAGSDVDRQNSRKHSRCRARIPDRCT